MFRPDEIITYDRLFQALDRAMKAEPPTGLEKALSRDSNLLADVFLPMVLARAKGVIAGSLEPMQQEALLRWSLDRPGGEANTLP